MTDPAGAYAAFRQRQSLAPIAAFAASLDLELDPFQLEACRALLRDEGVLVAAPTSAGKTLVALFGLDQAVSRGERCFYTTPIKALSNQKHRELCDYFGAKRVGLLTGDQSIRPEAEVVVMTTEVLRNMMYSDLDGLDRLGLVVVDEVHYLADRFRGPVWEEVLIQLPPAVKVVALSATVSNAEEFGGWLELVRGNMQVVVSDRRPVPLFQHVMTPGGLKDLFVATTKAELPARLNPELLSLRGQPGRPGPSGRPRSTARGHSGGRSRPARARRGANGNQPRGEVARVLDRAGLVPAIYFVFSRSGCDQAVAACLRSGLDLNQSGEAKRVRRIFETVAATLPPGDLPVVGYPELLQAASRGVGAHHAGLLPIFKEAVELAFQEGLIKVVFATETLSLGINMPARTVVMDRLDKWDGTSHADLTPGEYTQLTGRAGRRGQDFQGHAVVVSHRGFDPQRLLALASKRTYRLDSAFKPTYNMAVNLIRMMGTERSRQVLEMSFAQYQADRSVAQLAREVRQLDHALAGYNQAAQGQQGARWAHRIAKAQAKRQGLMKAIDTRTGSIARQFDQVQAVLLALGYLARPEGADAANQLLEVTEAGQILARIYSERDLVIAECLRRGVFDSLKPSDLAGVVAAMVFEPRGDSTSISGPANPVMAAAIKRAERAWRAVEAAELANRHPATPGLQPGACQAVALWAAGRDLAVVLPACDLVPGDFVRLVKQVIDVLEQIGLASGNMNLTRRCQAAGDRLHRGVVAASTA